LWRAFGDGLIDNDDKLASSRKCFQLKTRMQKPYPFLTKVAKIDILFMTKMAENHPIGGLAYCTYACVIGLVNKYPLPLGLKYM